MAAIKVTLTLPDTLLEVIDGFVAAHPGATRSAVCAEALREWVRAVQEAEIEHYYRTVSGEERAEDEAWASAATSSANRLWP